MHSVDPQATIQILKIFANINRYSPFFLEDFYPLEIVYFLSCPNLGQLKKYTISSSQDSFVTFITRLYIVGRSDGSAPFTFMT